MMTFLEFFGSNSKTQRKFSARTNPFDTKGDLRQTDFISKISSVPKYRQRDSSLNPKVERIRIGQSRFEILSPNDVQSIRTQYNIADLDETHPKKLSNMPIVIQFDPNRNTYILKRDG